MSEQATGFRSIEEIDQQLEALQKERALAIKNETKQALTEVKQLVSKYGLTAAQVFGEAKIRSPAEAKYRDPNTGKTWTGRGRQPSWFDAANPAEFLI